MPTNRLFLRTNRIMAARIDFARTDGKLPRTERPIARTDRISAARTGKWPHETNYSRTESKIVCTDRFRGCGKRFLPARNGLKAARPVPCFIRVQSVTKKTIAPNASNARRPCQTPSRRHLFSERELSQLAALRQTQQHDTSSGASLAGPVSYTHLRAHETG